LSDSESEQSTDREDFGGADLDEMEEVPKDNSQVEYKTRDPSVGKERPK
jgi:hypothetical protein